MYKIYINDTPLFLTTAEDGAQKLPGTEQNPVHRYSGKVKFLSNYIDMLEKTDRFESITLFANDYDKLVADFINLYKVIEAAGGVVFNEKEEVLMIYRLETWDLPKGKIDKGETPEIAAVREVEEETGLTNIERGELVKVTYHTYRTSKGKRILKRTYWYKMTTTDKELTPQTEEAIEIATWMPLSDALSKKDNMYGNIEEILRMI